MERLRMGGGAMPPPPHTPDELPTAVAMTLMELLLSKPPATLLSRLNSKPAISKGGSSGLSRRIRSTNPAVRTERSAKPKPMPILLSMERRIPHAAREG
jgi:hypothetical protein